MPDMTTGRTIAGLAGALTLIAGLVLGLHPTSWAGVSCGAPLHGNGAAYAADIDRVVARQVPINFAYHCEQSHRLLKPVSVGLLIVGPAVLLVAAASRPQWRRPAGGQQPA